MTRTLSTGIDPGKYTLHAVTLQWNANVGEVVLENRLPDRVCINTIDWTTKHGWEHGCRLFQVGVVSSETQWIDKHVFDRWAGIESVVHTRGAMRGMAASHGVREVVCGTKHAPVHEYERGDFMVFDVTAWRSIVLSPRTFSVRTSARTTEQLLARKLLEKMGLPPVNADHSAAMGIALARLGLNYHAWLPL